MTGWADEVFPHRTPQNALVKLIVEEVPELLTQRLSAIAGSDSSFRPTALEAQGLLAAERGNRETAVEHYTRITEGANVPPAQRRRAEHMLALLKE